MKVIDVWVSFTNDNKMQCEYTKNADVLKMEYDLSEYNNYRDALADFILDAGLSNYSIKTHYLN